MNGVSPRAGPSSQKSDQSGSQLDSSATDLVPDHIMADIHSNYAHPATVDEDEGYVSRRHDDNASDTSPRK